VFVPILALTGTTDHIPYFTSASTLSSFVSTSSGRALMGATGTAESFPYFSTNGTTVAMQVTNRLGRHLMSGSTSLAISNPSSGVQDIFDLMTDPVQTPYNYTRMPVYQNVMAASFNPASHVYAPTEDDVNVRTQIVSWQARTFLGSVFNEDHMLVVDGAYLTGFATTQSGRSLLNVSTAASGDIPFFTSASTVSRVSTTATARTLLGVALEANSIPYLSTTTPTVTAASTSLTSSGRALIGVTGAANTLAYFSTDANTVATTTLTAAGRNLLDDATVADQRTTLGLAIGTDVQAYDPELAAIAGLTSASNTLPYFTGSGSASLSTYTDTGRSVTGLTTISSGGLIVGSGTDTVTVLPKGTSGQVLTAGATTISWADPTGGGGGGTTSAPGSDLYLYSIYR